ncbi:MAG: hypothetical protein Q7S40_05210 [Opitutaceae bacterium]|nr:hypothetical protein [Opitutaceae bacterium]
MKPEPHAWQALQDHAARQLRGGFADRVLRSAHGPTAESWQQLFALGAVQLRIGFAERVLRAARNVPGVPSFLDQFVLSAGTAAVCALAVFLIQSHNTEIENEQNLASWQQIAMVAQDVDGGL